MLATDLRAESNYVRIVAIAVAKDVRLVVGEVISVRARDAVVAVEDQVHVVLVNVIEAQFIFLVPREGLGGGVCIGVVREPAVAVVTCRVIFVDRPPNAGAFFGLELPGSGEGSVDTSAGVQQKSHLTNDSPSIDVDARANANANRNNNADDIDCLFRRAHFLLFARENPQAAANERRHQQLRRDEGRRKAVVQRTHRRESRHRAVADRVRQWTQPDHAEQFQPVILEHQRQRGEALVALEQPVREIGQHGARDDERAG